MILVNALALSHHYAGKVVRTGDTAVDATAGKGKDTLFLSGLVGESGKVYAFDIQKKSIEMTKDLLQREGAFNNTVFINDSHANIDKYIKTETACVMFNLGYLPGEDHSIQTTGKTTMEAIVKSLGLLKTGGIVTIMIYQGGDTGFEERDMVVEFCENLDQRLFTVMKTSFENQKNYPPIFICIEKTI